MREKTVHSRGFRSLEGSTPGWLASTSVGSQAPETSASFLSLVRQGKEAVAASHTEFWGPRSPHVQTPKFHEGEPL